jgi:Spy/CpxP family protein refolding chaperone
MRVVGRSMVALAAAFVVVGLVGGQQPGGRGGFGGGKGGGNQDAYTLLRLDQVKKELAITDEQVEKIPAAVMKALSGVLDDKQMMRLRQIELQTRGTQAFLDAHVQKELKITPEQSGNIKTILDDSRKEQAEAFKEAQGGGGGFGAVQEKLAELRKETTEKVQAVLTSDQRRAFKQLVGEEFKLDMKGFGGGGKGKGKKKQDI